VKLATPGCLLDCLERGYDVNYVVLGEADHMIDMVFEPQVVGVLEATHSRNLKYEKKRDQLPHWEVKSHVDEIVMIT
jgi:superfamily II DNA/RNA helicase